MVGFLFSSNRITYGSARPGAYTALWDTTRSLDYGWCWRGAATTLNTPRRTSIRRLCKTEVLMSPPLRRTNMVNSLSRLDSFMDKRAQQALTSIALQTASSIAGSLGSCI